jgi:hypothetical protein
VPFPKLLNAVDALGAFVAVGLPLRLAIALFPFVALDDERDAVVDRFALLLLERDFVAPLLAELRLGALGALRAGAGRAGAGRDTAMVRFLQHTYS